MGSRGSALSPRPFDHQAPGPGHCRISRFSRAYTVVLAATQSLFRFIYSFVVSFVLTVAGFRHPIETVFFVSWTFSPSSPVLEPFKFSTYFSWGPQVSCNSTPVPSLFCKFSSILSTLPGPCRISGTPAVSPPFSFVAAKDCARRRVSEPTVRRTALRRRQTRRARCKRKPLFVPNDRLVIWGMRASWVGPARTGDVAWGAGLAVLKLSVVRPRPGIASDGSENRKVPAFSPVRYALPRRTLVECQGDS